MKLLTVSIAAYHVEDYLRETLDSFLIPEVTDQLEVLIVNDGSGEGVNEIAREYEANYPDVFRLIDKENGGHGSTVNRGIEEAAGKYFKTVDGDDYVSAEGLKELLSYLQTAEADLVVNDYHSFNDASGVRCTMNFREKSIGKYMHLRKSAAKFTLICMLLLTARNC